MHRAFLDYDPEPRPVRIAVLGSCVTRDAFGDTSEAHGYSVTTTLIKQSISATLTPPTPVDAPGFNGLNRFETRCLQANLDKDVFDRLAAGDPEWVLIDLIDERCDLAIARNGGLITRAMGFLRNSRVLDDPEHGFLTLRRGWAGVEIATLADMPAWLDRLRAIVPENRIVLHKAYWSTMIDTPDGPVPLDETQAARSQRNNLMLSRLYRRLTALAPAMHTIGLPEAERIIDPDHRWGPEAFHYTAQYYEGYRRRLDRIIAPTRWMSARISIAEPGTPPEQIPLPGSGDPIGTSFVQGCRYTTDDPWHRGPGDERSADIPTFEDVETAPLTRARQGCLDTAITLLHEDRRRLNAGSTPRLRAGDGAALAAFAALRATREGAQELGLRLRDGHGFIQDAQAAEAWLARGALWPSSREAGTDLPGLRPARENTAPSGTTAAGGSTEVNTEANTKADAYQQ